MQWTPAFFEVERRVEFKQVIFGGESEIGLGRFFDHVFEGAADHGGFFGPGAVKGEAGGVELLALFGAEVRVAVPAEEFGFGFLEFLLIDEGFEDVWGEVVAGEAVFGGVAGLVLGIGFGDFVEDRFVGVLVT